MEYDKKMIKEDINFLEYPNWVIDRKNKDTRWNIKKNNGEYEILCPLGLPKHFDKIVLYFLLHKLYREKNLDSYLLTTTRHEIAKNVFPYEKAFGTNRYKRIMDSLKKWNSVAINFKGVFYDGDEYRIKSFHIINEFTLTPSSGELSICFNESYVKQLKETKFYMLIDFEQYKKLHKTSSARLYEILVKNYKERNEWAINIQLLAEKLTFEKRENAHSYYPSDVLRYLKPSINEINKKTDLEIGFNYNKETGICIFKKLKKQKELYIPATKDTQDEKIKKTLKSKKQIAACVNYFKTLPVTEQEIILGNIKKQPFLEFLPDQDSRIFAYMTNAKQWQQPE